jgi:hypothetical protein
MLLPGYRQIASSVKMKLFRIYLSIYKERKASGLKGTAIITTDNSQKDLSEVLSGQSFFWTPHLGLTDFKAMIQLK